MAQLRVAVLRGGPSFEHEVSLASGQSVIDAFSRTKKYSPLDILIRKNGEWTLKDVPVLPEKALRMSDVAFVALHGKYGEDGEVQRILETHKIPFTGSLSHASFLGMNKIFSRKAFEDIGLLIPRGIVVEEEEDLEESAKIIFKNMPPYWVVKPISGGSSLGVKLAKNFTELIESIKHAFGFSKKILVEEAISGREFTCGVIDHFREEKHYALPAVEIIPHKNKSFFDYEAKYGGFAVEICPAKIDEVLRKKLAHSAILAHQSIGARHYSRTDFMVDRRGNIYTLEINTLPGMTASSLFPKALDAVGANQEHFLDHIVSLSLSGK